MLVRRLITASLFAGLAPGLVAQAGAAVPVEDMSTREVQDARTADPRSQVPMPLGSRSAPATELAQDRPALSPGQNAQLFYELQALQAELQQLRGVVDDQAYEISRLRSLQRSQYLDIDRRLTEGGHSPSQLPNKVAKLTDPVPVLPQRDPQPQTSPQPTSPTVAQSTIRDTSADLQVPVPVVQTATAVTSGSQPTPQPSTTVAVASNGTDAVTMTVAPTEKEAFERAFELMKDQQFEQSIAAYQAVIERFPDGSYAPESRYWLGELYLMSEQLAAARDAFVTVVEEFPAHQKVPLSLYKLGVVNHRLDATRQALEYLDSVVTRYPDTPAAGLARTYAAELR